MLFLFRCASTQCATHDVFRCCPHLNLWRKWENASKMHDSAPNVHHVCYSSRWFFFWRFIYKSFASDSTVFDTSRWIRLNLVVSHYYLIICDTVNWWKLFGLVSCRSSTLSDLKSKFAHWSWNRTRKNRFTQEGNTFSNAIFSRSIGGYQSELTTSKASETLEQTDCLFDMMKNFPETLRFRFW